jgi:putative transposase
MNVRNVGAVFQHAQAGEASMDESFEGFFKRATGHEPFPFQTRLATEGERMPAGVASRIRRRSMRMCGCDHAAAGAYFVTMFARDHACVFGDVTDAVMRPNDPGRTIETVWHELPGFYSGVNADEFIVMPNHIHGIVVLVGATPCGRPDVGQARGPAPTVMSLSDVAHRFKTMATKRYADGVKQSGWTPRPDVNDNLVCWAVDIRNPATTHIVTHTNVGAIHESPLQPYGNAIVWTRHAVPKRNSGGAIHANRRGNGYDA